MQCIIRVRKAIMEVTCKAILSTTITIPYASASETERSDLYSLDVVSGLKSLAYRASVPMPRSGLSGNLTAARLPVRAAAGKRARALAPDWVCARASVAATTAQQ